MDQNCSKNSVSASLAFLEPLERLFVWLVVLKQSFMWPRLASNLVCIEDALKLSILLLPAECGEYAYDDIIPGVFGIVLRECKTSTPPTDPSSEPHLMLSLSCNLFLEHSPPYPSASPTSRSHELVDTDFLDPPLFLLLPGAMSLSKTPHKGSLMISITTSTPFPFLIRLSPSSHRNVVQTPCLGQSILTYS